MYQSKKLYIAANGCHENFMDAELLKRFLEQRHGFRIVDQYGAAEIIVVMGCSVTNHKESEALDIINHFRLNQGNNVKVFSLGCITKIKPELKNGDIRSFLPIDEIESLFRMDSNSKQLAVNKFYKQDQYLERFLRRRKEKVFYRYTHSSTVGSEKEEKSLGFQLAFNVIKKYKEIIESRINIYNDKTYVIKISTGCCGNCSYCTIKKGRGNVISKPIQKILNEFERGLQAGYKDFALIGTDIGDYGKDQGLDLINLLETLSTVDNYYKLRLRNLNPRWIVSRYNELLNLPNANKLSYIESPVQSGNDRILELMNRGYHAKEFMNAVDKIHRKFPRICLRTQIIVGFPTENHQEFMDSVHIMDKGIINYADIFRFEPRNHTIAASIEPKIPSDIIMRRYLYLFFKTIFQHPIRKLVSMIELNT